MYIVCRLLPMATPIVLTNDVIMVSHQANSLVYVIKIHDVNQLGCDQVHVTEQCIL